MSARRLVASAFVMLIALASATYAAIAAMPFQSSALLQQQPGPMEQAAKPASGANPIPVRLASVAPLFPPEAANVNATAALTFRAIVDTGGSVAELRLLSLDVALDSVTVRMSGSGGIDQMIQAIERARFGRPDAQPADSSAIRATIVAFIDSAAAAIQQWRYEAPREPVAFDVMIRFAADNQVIDRITAPASSAAQMSSDGALRVGGGVKAPMKVKDVRPIYPEEARQAGIQGVVIAEVRILADGRVGDARILRSIPALDAAALEAIRQWEFTPTHLNGVATPVIMTVTIQFSLP